MAELRFTIIDESMYTKCCELYVYKYFIIIYILVCSFIYAWLNVIEQEGARNVGLER